MASQCHEKKKGRKDSEAITFYHMVVVVNAPTNSGNLSIYSMCISNYIKRIVAYLFRMEKYLRK